MRAVIVPEPAAGQILVLVGVGVWLLVRATGGGAPTPTTSARETLAQRYARGEIDEQEYHQRLHTLGS